MLYNLYQQNIAYNNEAIPPSHLLFLVQTKVIRDIATKSSCVIVGRGADYILKGYPNLFRLFVHTDNVFRRERTLSQYHIPSEKVETTLGRKDGERANYYKYYSGRKWQDLGQYDLTLDTSGLGIEASANLILYTIDSIGLINSDTGRRIEM